MKSEFVLGPRAAVLEVGAPSAADQERVAGEDAVAHQEAVGIVGVAGRVEHVQRQALDGELVAFRHPHRDHVHLGVLAHHRDAVRAIAQRAEARDVVGMNVRVDRLDQLEVQLLHQLQVPVDLLQDGIDDQRLATVPAGHQIAVGARCAVEQLAENHGDLHGIVSTIILAYAPCVVRFASVGVERRRLQKAYISGRSR